MESLANLIYWVFGACAVAGLSAIAFVWERMRRDLNLALPAQQKVPIYPRLLKTFRRTIFPSNNLGHFVEVLDQYEHAYPYSSLPKKLAFALIAWILCFMGLLASEIGH